MMTVKYLIKRVIKPVCLSVMAVCSVLAQASTEDVTVLEKGQQSSCQLLGSNSCSSESSDAVTECLSEHKNKAFELKADALLIAAQEEFKQRRPSLAGGMKTITRLEMTADYYQCGFTRAVHQSAQPVPQAPGWQQVEGRLQNLESLKDKGLISQDEYDAKRQLILNDL